MPAGPMASGALAAAAALARGRSQDELARMAAFFTALGALLALFALAAPGGSPATGP